METTLITIEEENLAREAMAYAKELGADSVRITITKSLMDLTGTLDGQIDKVSHCLDRSLSICLFAQGHFGSFSTNRIERDELRKFVSRAMDTIAMLAPDQCRALPSKERKATDATSGMELGLYDPSYETVTPEQRLSIALDAAVTGKERLSGGKLVSEEAEYSDSCFDLIVMDSDGLYARHSETSFEYGVEVTVEDEQGSKFTGYWWDAAPFMKDLNAGMCGQKAIDRACAQMNPQPLESGKFKVVIDTEVASKVVTPVLNALGGYSLQQNNSFLRDSLGKQIFPEGMTITDDCRKAGLTGSRLFDSEGVATRQTAIIDKGKVCQYFINTYISNKMHSDATIEDATRPKVQPWPEAGLDRAALLSRCGDGILITGFNGGNSNSATGDFSFGIEGFAFKDGTICHPIHEMLMTGNFIELWKGLLAVGDDARACTSRSIPSLAFEGVDISA